MAKVTVVQVIYNSKRFIEPVFNAIFAQTFKDFDVVAVIAGNADGGKELLAEKFPKVSIIDPAYNIGFAAGHNLVFEKYDSEFFQLVNPDLIMEPNYISEMLKAFADPKVGAVTGKLLFYDFKNNTKTNIIDSTGIAINQQSGRIRDRGQHETDNGQYDDLKLVKSVCGAGAMYRRSALDTVKQRQETGGKQLTSKFEYFDEDFHSYWEDVDLGWRITNAGWKCLYEPSALAYHGRGTASSVGGYKRIFNFIKHHRKINPWIRQQGYKNHMFTYIKNSPWFYPQFFVREFFMFFYVLLFEISTLKVVPEMFRLFPKMWKKRKYIKLMAPPGGVTP